jgi:hypothetical protein
MLSGAKLTGNAKPLKCCWSMSRVQIGSEKRAWDRDRVPLDCEAGMSDERPE